MTLEKGAGAWSNHPAVKMWKGYEIPLSDYGWFMCREWKRRGFVDNLSPYFEDSRALHNSDGKGQRDPQFIQDKVFQTCHRRVLIYKGWQDAVWAFTLQHYPYFKGTKTTNIDAAMRLYSSAIDVKNTHYGKQWPDLEPLAPVNGSFPYVWPKGE